MTTGTRYGGTVAVVLVHTLTLLCTDVSMNFNASNTSAFNLSNEYGTCLGDIATNSCVINAAEVGMLVPCIL